MASSGYRFRPETSDLEAQALTFVDEYRRNRLQIMESMGGDIGRSAREVADSLKTRGEDDR
jgi:hypothetical protein